MQSLLSYHAGAGLPVRIGAGAAPAPPLISLIAPSPTREVALEVSRCVLARGRKDGNSGRRKAEYQRRRRQRIRESEDGGISSNWWEEDGRLREGGS